MTWEDVGIDVDPSRTEGEVLTHCPKCSESRRKKNVRCLSANLDKQAWHCHHCGWSGFLASGERVGSQPPRRQEFFRPTDFPKGIGAKARAWLEGRGITQEVIERNGVVSGPAWMPQEEAFVEALWFPYRLDGKPVNVKFRDGKKNFRMMAGAQRVPYGMDDIGESGTVVWVEGEIDKLSVEVAGIPHCLSVPDGAPSPTAKDYTSKFAFLDPFMTRFEGKRHILAVDADAPGVVLRDELARRLGRENCWLVDWPEGLKDANECLLRDGAVTLKWLLDNARPYPIEGLVGVEQHEADVWALWEHGWTKGEDTGWTGLNGLYTVRPGEWTMVSGIPGHGKSSWLDALTVNLAKRCGWKFVVFSAENYPTQAHIAKLLEIWSGFPFGEGPRVRIDAEDVQRGLEWIREHYWWLTSPDGFSVAEILERARFAVRRYGVRGLILDPWNEIEHNRHGNQTETDYISESLTQIRRFARSNGIHIWVVVHPAKLRRDENGKYPVPTPYDAAGSAHWRNKADNAVCVWRDVNVDGGPVEIHVQKIRFREIGKVGVGRLRFVKHCGQYVDL